MKHTIVLAAFAILFSLTVNAQSAVSTVEYRPSFSAVVVNNVENSAQWYQSVFGLKLKEKMGDEKAGYKVFILESPAFTLELLELKGSLIRKELLQGKSEGTQIQGHFKIGFKTSDMDASLKQLASLKITVPQVWTDPKTKKRNFLISDPDGNLVQLFE